MKRLRMNPCTRSENHVRNQFQIAIWLYLSKSGKDGGKQSLRPKFPFRDLIAIALVFPLALNTYELVLHTIRSLYVNAGLRLTLTTVHLGVISLPHISVKIKAKTLKVLPIFWRWQRSAQYISHIRNLVIEILFAYFDDLGPT